jgi:cellulose synthase/poly-beta-1,6-N-acetylglucosamine synthase-like glycosyltransferase
MRRMDFIAELGMACERNQTNAPRASIVVTNDNSGRFVARCIDSALAQSYPDTEVVVVDDASRDHSRDIIESYGKRVVPILLKRNGGQGAAFVARAVAALAPGVAQVQFRMLSSVSLQLITYGNSRCGIRSPTHRV